MERLVQRDMTHEDQVTTTAEMPSHHIVSREAIPAMDHEDTGERVVCSCGRSVRSIFPWLITRWMEDHNAFA